LCGGKGGKRQNDAEGRNRAGFHRTSTRLDAYEG
jgi:hypothetical protein